MMDSASLFASPVFRLGAATFTVGHVMATAGGVILFLMVLMAIMVARASRARAVAAAEAEERLRELARTQAELHGRLGTMAEILGSRQAELTRALTERLDGMTHRLGTSIHEQTKATHENLAKLQERLAVIDTAQNNIQALAGQVVQLQQILSNKQTRGAFGQARMEVIIADALPSGAYEFQATLSNGARPDCLIRMPNGAPSLVVDAKFPLEAWNAMKAAGSEGSAEARKAAETAFRRDIEVHIRAISEKYLINGETQELAFMFVPSESIFAEIHENFEALVQRAHRARVVIVSPSLLMLSVQVIQSVLRDARMREQAHLIQAEVVKLMEDVTRLDERVRKLQGHFFSAQKDVEMILTSADKITKRGSRIEALELGEAETGGAVRKSGAGGGEKAGPVSPGQGRLQLRVVDE